MMSFRQRFTVGLALALVLALAAAGAARAADEPDYVVVQHILIGFKKSVPGKDVTRSKRDARALADELLAEAQAGAEFDALVKEHTDDSYPGIYGMTNKNAPRRAGARPRDGMTARFGDVGFRLEVGEVGLAGYHAALSPYGWHVIKRIE